MTEKEAYEIAKLWGANILRSCDGGCNDLNTLSDNDMELILKQLWVIADMLNPLKFATLGECIIHVLN